MYEIMNPEYEGDASSVGKVAASQRTMDSCAWKQRTLHSMHNMYPHSYLP